ncbi:MAG: carboxypeptidase regulatory-like domain-containing protein [Deltaproteobacteria bacterium]|nr:MAG: carboxypeptidase regulatory-like domain-containing protein [Deltaproteobacteria bacterium]
MTRFTRAKSKCSSRKVVLVALWTSGWSLLVATSPPPPPASCPTGTLSFYQGQVVDDTGAAVTNATVTVVPNDNPSTSAPLFADPSSRTALSQPVAVNANGRYSFYVAPGSYDITASVGSTVVYTLVSVPIVDPRKAHATVGSNFDSPVTLAESATATTNGNAAIILERLASDGTRIRGPWILQVNKGASGDRTDLRWLYNADWNEMAQTSTSVAVNEPAYAIRIAPRGTPGTTQQFSFAFDYSPSPSELGGSTTPQWTNLFTQEEATAPNIGPAPHARVNGTGQTAFVVGDGLANSSLVARRDGWICYNKPAPAGVLARLEDIPTVPCGAGVATVCECVGSPGCGDAMHPCPGDVVVPFMNGSAVGASWATQSAQRDATVYMKIGNGTLPSVLSVGKALVRVQSGVTISPGDIVVSSGSSPGTAKGDNSTTDPRSIIGFALEHAGATLPGYVAIVRTNR